MNTFKTNGIDILNDCSWGFDVKEPIYKKDRPQEVKHATCSANKARELLNYKTKVSLKLAILNPNQL